LARIDVHAPQDYFNPVPTRAKHDTSMSIALPFTSLRKSLGPRCAQYVRVPTIQKLLSWPALDQRALATAASPETIPYRKQLKDEARQRRLSGDAEHGAVKKTREEKAKHWELTVGIEVHAQLNTDRKLFSSMSWPLDCFEEHMLITDQGARTSIDAEPNSRVALFDLAYPGTQPVKSNRILLQDSYSIHCRNFRERP